MTLAVLAQRTDFSNEERLAARNDFIGTLSENRKYEEAGDLTDP